MLSGMREMKYEESYWELIKKRFQTRFTPEEREEFMYKNECMMVVRTNKDKHHFDMKCIEKLPGKP